MKHLKWIPVRGTISDMTHIHAISECVYLIQHPKIENGVLIAKFGDEFYIKGLGVWECWKALVRKNGEPFSTLKEIDEYLTKIKLKTVKKRKKEYPNVVLTVKKKWGVES